MSLFELDEYNCTKCGICADVCPAVIISRPDGDTFPSVPEAYENMCIHCGHCEVFCPSKALLFNDRPEHRMTLHTEDHTIPPEVLSLYMKKRRSIRCFKKITVPEDIILSLIETASYAPSGGNRQPVKWLVLHDPAKVRKVAELTIEWMKTLLRTDHPLSHYVTRIIAGWRTGRDTICLGAPHLVITHVPDGNPAFMVDAVIAMTYIDIAAQSYGVGTCWAGFVMMASSAFAPLREELALPEDRKAAAVMMTGYPKYTVHGIPRKKTPDITWRL